MPTATERLRHVTPKIRRAKQHVTDLEREIRRFLDTSPYKVASKVDSQTKRPTYYVSSVEPTPESLPLIAGDAVQNLVSALDHLAFQLVCSDTGDNPPKPNRIYFPIADDAAKYEAKKNGKMMGASQATIKAIDALRPYNGGNDLLWVLHELNNIEKHRLLLTVGSCAAGMHLGQLMARLSASSFPRAAVVAMKEMSGFLMPADKGFPLRPGFELYVGAPNERPDPDQQFRFNVALNEPGVIDSKSLLETLHQLTTSVESVITDLMPCLKDTP